MRRSLPILLLLACSGCQGAQRFFYAESAGENERGMRVQLEGGSLLGGPSGVIENVGKCVMFPAGYAGPMPPGWAVPEKPRQP